MTRAARGGPGSDLHGVPDRAAMQVGVAVDGGPVDRSAQRYRPQCGHGRAPDDR